MKMLYGDRFFYILYFQQPGVAEAELDADAYDSMAKILWGAGGAGFAARVIAAVGPRRWRARAS